MHAQELTYHRHHHIEDPLPTISSWDDFDVISYPPSTYNYSSDWSLCGVGGRREESAGSGRQYDEKNVKKYMWSRDPYGERFGLLNMVLGVFVGFSFSNSY